MKIFTIVFKDISRVVGLVPVQEVHFLKPCIEVKIIIFAFAPTVLDYMYSVVHHCSSTLERKLRF